MGKASRKRNREILDDFYHQGEMGREPTELQIERTLEHLETDTFHSFDDLYRHRYVLFVSLCRTVYLKYLFDAATMRGEMPDHVWISKQHADGTMFDDSFIVGMNLEDIGQVSYHLPLSEWQRVASLMPMAIVKNAPEWDGHTPDDVVARLEEWTYGVKAKRR